MRCVVAVIVLWAGTWTHAVAQTPQPFPRAQQPAQAPTPAQPPPQARPAEPATPPLRSPANAPAQPAPQQPARAATPAVQPAAAPVADVTPTAQSLGLPLYPAAQYIATYDAGRGQKYVLFGTTAAFTEIVTYYRTQLDEKGDLVFREPPTHSFEVGRFREETMAFPPGVTVKDYTWGGRQGYPNPKLNAQPARFPTIIMLVPQPPPAAAPQR